MNAYDFHRSIDFLILQATSKILSAKSLEKSKHYFNSDFVNDSGIINLLRKTYLEKGDFEKTFNLYQNSRLEPKSYRYESLMTLLIVTAVGNVIGGILLDVYQTHKGKIIKLFDKNTLDSIKTIPKKIQDKFINGKNDSIKKDFKNLINCYIARHMLGKQLIDLDSYYKLVAFYICGNEIDTELAQHFDQLIEKYSLEKDAIKVDTLYEMIEAYGKGTFLKYLDEENCNILYFDNIKTADKINGIFCFCPGACKGKIIKGVDSKSLLSGNNDSKKILCIEDYSPDHIEILRHCYGAVTWGCDANPTDHLQVTCRSLGMPCVIIDESDANLLIDNDDIAIDGNNGIVYTGLWVEN